jgi:ligand-binding SRPBCC domain-containing protein
MGFDILNKELPNTMYPGFIIAYKAKPLPWFKTLWVSEITHIEQGKYFIDEQRKGPYKMWHHEHFIEPHAQGVLMTDIVSYMPPFGIIGTLANWLFISKQLEKIFAYRIKAIDEIFKKA